MTSEAILSTSDNVIDADIRRRVDKARQCASVANRRRVATIFCCFLPSMAIVNLANAAPHSLVFSVLRWEGEYRTQDRANGVEQNPSHGAIYGIDATGRGMRKLVDWDENTSCPRFSRDGAWLYFQVVKNGQSQVCRCRPDGTNITHLSARHQLGDEWSNAFGGTTSGDGWRLAYTVHNGKVGHIVIGDSDGTDARFVVRDLGYTYMAALDESGDRIAFSGPAKGYRLLLASAPFDDASVLTPDHPDCYVPQFTPDGKTIVFQRRDGIYSIGTEDRQVQRLADTAGYVEFRLSKHDQHGSTDGPHLAPDGKRIAYISAETGLPQVFAINVDGSNKQQLTSRASACGRVRWSPDGRQLAFVSWDGDYPQLFVTPASDPRPRKLTNLDAAVYWVDWQPETDVPKN